MASEQRGKSAIAFYVLTLYTMTLVNIIILIVYKNKLVYKNFILKVYTLFWIPHVFSY